MGLCAFVFRGEDRPPQGVGSFPQALKSLYAFKASIGKSVFRGFWGNLPGLLGKPLTPEWLPEPLR